MPAGKPLGGIVPISGGAWFRRQDTGRRSPPSWLRFKPPTDAAGNGIADWSCEHAGEKWLSYWVCRVVGFGRIRLQVNAVFQAAMPTAARHASKASLRKRRFVADVMRWRQMLKGACQLAGIEANLQLWWAVRPIRPQHKQPHAI